MNSKRNRPLARKWSAGLIVTLGLALPSLSVADDQIGGTRSAGMAGAGLALPIDIGQNHRLNPAMLGYSRARLTFQYPSFGYHLSGLTMSDIKDKFGNLGKGGVNDDKLVDIARTLGSRTTSLGVDLSLGIEMGGLSLDAEGSANISTVPNPYLVTDSQNITPTDTRDQLDAFGFTEYQVGVSYGKVIKTSNGHFSMGATVKAVTAFYAHKFVNGTTITTGTGPVASGPEIGSGDYNKQSSAGVDLGFLYDAGANSNVYYGMTITNFVEPSISFTHFVPVTAGGATTEVRGDNINPFKRSYNLGVGGVVGGKILLAADLYDFGNQNGDSQLRLGAEYAIGHGFAVRTGYNTITGWAVGFSVLGVNFAYASNSQLTAALGVKF